MSALSQITENVLNDLPPTFIPANLPILQAEQIALEPFSDSVQFFAQNFNLLNANFGFLDWVASLFGYVRLAGESDYSFRNRVIANMTSPCGYYEAIQNYLIQVTGIPSIQVVGAGQTVITSGNEVIVQTSGSFLINVNIYASVSSDVINLLAQVLNNVRPVGVPIGVYQITSPQLDTILDISGSPPDASTYLSSSGQAHLLNIPLPPFVVNTESQFSTVLMNDPLLS